MAGESAGGWRPLSSSRSLVVDLLHYERQAPMFVHERLCSLGRVVEARARAARRISWSVMFLKAYGLVAAECPPLRQCYLKWPWPHLYEHPHSVGTLVISRPHQGEERLFWARFSRPEREPLTAMQDRLERRYLEGAVEEHFRRQLLVSRLPFPLRRFAWWTTLNLSGSTRARRMGTFGLTTLAAEGAEICRPPSPITTTLTYGPLDDAGKARVAIVYDHRVVDGKAIARCLARLEEVLSGQIVAELLSPSLATPGRKSADRPRGAAA